MDLAFDHEDLAAKRIERRIELVEGANRDAFGRGDAEIGEKFFSLVFVEVHYAQSVPKKNFV
jgi:hypothetical protein